MFVEDIWYLMLIRLEKITAGTQSLCLPQAVIISAYIRSLNIIKKIHTLYNSLGKDLVIIIAFLLQQGNIFQR